MSEHEDDDRFEALCDRLHHACLGEPLNLVRCALSATLAEAYIRLPLPERSPAAEYDLAMLRQYVAELPP